jgi:hypothetical protein
MLTSVVCLSCGGESTAPGAAVAASLEIFPGQNVGGITMGGSMEVPVKLFSATRTEIPMPPGLTFISRNPAAIAVESGTRIRTVAPMSSAWLVASLDYQGRTFVDSTALSVVCTAELRISIRPDSAVLNVDDKFTPTVELSGCGGYVRVTDTFSFTAFYPTNSTVTGVISVDALTGETTALKSGFAWTVVRGANHGLLGAIPVTVR